MSICIVTSTFPRYIGDSHGPWILEYAIQLTKLGFEVHVLCPMTHASGEKSKEMMEDVFVHRFSYWPVKQWQNLTSPPGIIPNLKNYEMTKFQVIPFLFTGWLALFKLVKKYRIKLILAQWVIPSGFLGLTVKKITKIPIIISAQGAEFYVKNRLMELFVRETMKKCDLILPVSYHMKKLGESFGLDPNKSQVVPNAVNISIFKRTRPHSIKGTFNVLTVRRLVPEKRVQDLIRAFANFKKKRKNVLLTTIGDGPERGKLEQLAEKLDCSKEIRFLGFIPNDKLPRYYSEADVYVLSSVQEGLSLSLLEAMACELPVISTNIVGNPEVIRHKKNGFLVSPRNPAEVEAGLNFFYENRDKLNKFGKASRETVKMGFTSEVIAKQIGKIYRSLVSNP